jgi:hypothetical protein
MHTSAVFFITRDSEDGPIRPKHVRRFYGFNIFVRLLHLMVVLFFNISIAARRSIAGQWSRNKQLYNSRC